MPTPTYAVNVEVTDLTWDTDTHQWDTDTRTWDDAGFLEVQSDVLTRDSLQWFRGRDQIRNLAPPRAGFVAFSLRNDDAAYDVGSAVVSGAKVRVRALDPTTSVRTLMARGIIETLTRRPERAQQSVGVLALGTLVQAGADRTGASTLLYQDITTGTAIGHLLTAVGWPTADRSLDGGKTTLEWWWLDEAEDPFDALRALLDAEGPGAALYENGEGWLVFKDRHARVTEARSAAIQTTFRGATTEPLMSEPIAYDTGEHNIINVATMTRRARSAAALGSVWSLGETLTLAANEARTFTVRQTDRVPFTAAVAPTSGAGDFTVTAGSIASATLDRTSGSSAILTMTAGTSGATVTGLRVRAQSVAIDAETDVTSTQAVSGVRKPPPASWRPRAEVSLNAAQDLVNAMVAFHSAARPTVEFAVHGNRGTAALTACLVREINDRMRVISTLGAIDIEAYIEQVRHRVTAGPLHTTTFGVEAADAVGLPFILDTDTLDNANRKLWF